MKMKTKLASTACLLFLGLGMNTSAAVRYVNVNGASPSPPYTNWGTAATNIQDAIDVAAAGDEIVVTNGVYASGGRTVPGSSLTNRVMVDRPLTLRSVNGPDFTVLRGYQVPGSINGNTAIRCLYLTDGAALSGFTLTSGATRTEGSDSDQSGGGVRCEFSNVRVTNCVITGNSAYFYGGGASGGGATLDNCTIANNSASFGGGTSVCTLNNCTVNGNTSYMGGGDYASILNNCILAGNSAQSDALVIWAGRGGAACMSVLNNCALTDNLAWIGGGASGGVLNNCILAGNRAQTGGGASGNDYFGVLCPFGCDAIGVTVWVPATLNNCTLVDNTAEFGGGTFASAANNCILYYNTATNGPNWYEPDNITFTLLYGPDNVTFTSCCTTPMPTNGVGNFTDEPLFIDAANGNFRLHPHSPCINAGDNNVTTSTDLDGNPRVSGGTVDVGAYEFVYTPAMSLARLLLLVQDSDLDGKTKQSLLASLNAALISLNHSNSAACANQLAAFQNKVRAQIAPWNPALAVEWTATAQQIIADESGLIPK